MARTNPIKFVVQRSDEGKWLVSFYRANAADSAGNYIWKLIAYRNVSGYFKALSYMWRCMTRYQGSTDL